MTVSASSSADLWFVIPTTTIRSLQPSSVLRAGVVLVLCGEISPKCVQLSPVSICCVIPYFLFGVRFYFKSVIKAGHQYLIVDDVDDETTFKKLHVSDQRKSICFPFR